METQTEDALGSGSADVILTRQVQKVKTLELHEHYKSM